eukprot:jgi/Antlo1/2451/1617
MDSNQKRIKEHYDNIKDVGPEKREVMETINIRKMNNFIKSMLINEHVPENSTILDVGCGKGGDLKKFAARRIRRYYGLDISKNSIDNAKKRYQSSYFKFQAEFLVRDTYNSLFHIGTKFDVISIQFSLHYAFMSMNTLRTTLQNIKNHLSSNGKVIASVPNSEVLLRRYKKYGNKYGNNFYSVNFVMPYEQIQSISCKLGIEYMFTLSNSLDNCIEYLVDMNALNEECNSTGLKIVEYTDFLTYFNRNVKKNIFLYNKMIQNKLTDDELKVCELYSVLVIKNVDTSQNHADASSDI